MRKRLIGCLIAMVALLVSGCGVKSQKLQGTVANEHFGAAVDIDGDTMAIGAHEADTAKRGRGTVHIYVRSGDIWKRQAMLTAKNKKDSHRFGATVAISGDTVVVGAHSTENVFVFVRSGTTWAQQARVDRKVTGSIGFGSVVAIDGETMVATAQRWPTAETQAHVFERSGTSWKLTKNLPQGGDAVSIQGDMLVLGNRLADGPKGKEAGAVYVFTRSSASGDRWKQQAKLQAADHHYRQDFGRSVSLDGNRLAVGSFDKGSVGGIYYVGAVYIFERSSTTWTQKAKLAGKRGGHHYGNRVRLQGNLMLVHASENHNPALRFPSSGWVYVLHRGATGNWTEQVRLQSDVGRPDTSHFGRSIALDNGVAVVGDIADLPPGWATGQVFVYNDLHTQLGVSRMSIATCGGFRAAMGCDGDGPCLPEPGEVIPPELVHHLWTLASDEYSRCSDDREGCHPDLELLMQIGLSCSQDHGCAQLAVDFVLDQARQTCGLN